MRNDPVCLFPPSALLASLELPVVAFSPRTPADPAYRTNPAVGCYSEQEYSRKYFKKCYCLFFFPAGSSPQRINGNFYLLLPLLKVQFVWELFA